MKHLLGSVQEKELTAAEQEFLAHVKEAEQRFDNAMDDDLNTADALGAIFELVKEANVTLNAESSKAAVESALKSLKALCDVLGILQKEDDTLPEDIQRMVDERAEARKNKDWKRSDELRDAIKAAGYILEDSREGQKVRKSV